MKYLAVQTLGSRCTRLRQAPMSGYAASVLRGWKKKRSAKHATPALIGGYLQTAKYEEMEMLEMAIDGIFI